MDRQADRQTIQREKEREEIINEKILIPHIQADRQTKSHTDRQTDR
jgi:hypothetical protein